MPINGQINEKEVQVIDENGQKLGVFSIEEALEKAEKLAEQAEEDAKELEEADGSDAVSCGGAVFLEPACGAAV